MTAFAYRKPIRGSLIWWLRVLGMIALVVLLFRLPKSRDLELTHVDLRWLGWCMLLTFLQLLLEAAVWRRLLAAQHIHYPYPKTILSYLASQYLGLVTPGHVGEFLGAAYISSDTGITMGYALSSVVMKKVLTWVTVVSFGLWGLPLLTSVPLLHGIKNVAWGAAIVVVVLSLAVVVWGISLRRLAKKWRKLSPWQVDMTELRSGLRHLCSIKLAWPLVLAAAAFSLLFLQVDALLRSLGIVVPLLLIAKIVALSRIAARIVPLSLAGFGSKDAALILLLAQSGLTVSVGITVTALMFVCVYLPTLLLSGLCWWIKPLMVRRAQAASSPGSGWPEAAESTGGRKPASTGRKR
ncbi:MAG: flippase-like domain-containing protein [Candidatus Omnitrophica bacterium]|nr:flippase-like domain-containing protein [Candidatus Omnitrophota bacterium]